MRSEPYEYTYMPGEIVGEAGCVYRGYTQPGKALFMCHLCGKEFETHFAKVLRGHTKSCGCYGMEKLKKASTKHGLAGHPLYSTWQNIKSRCFSEKNDMYEYYGGRGITLYDEWVTDFKAFHDYLIDLDNYGELGMTLDRIENDGNYEPENLQWADRHMQAVNQRMRVDNTSGYVGVYRRANDRWMASICINKEEVHIGRYTTKEDAVNGRNQFIEDNDLTEYKVQEVRHG